MKFDNFAGEMSVSSDEAITYIKTWFKPDDKICIVGRRNIKSGKLDTLSQSVTAKEFIGTLTDEHLHSLIFAADGSLWNTYVAIAPVKEDVGLTKRGTEENVDYIPGVYADIDVKDKGFTSQEEILEYLDSLKLEPTMVCGSGSGGVHAYWRLHWEEQANRDLLERWWSYLDEAAEDRQIDKLIDSTRILRLPGTVYFPKEGSGGNIGSVKLLRVSGKTYSATELTSISEPAYAVKTERRKSLIRSDQQRKFEMEAFARSALQSQTGNYWATLRAISELEGYVNSQIPWADILEPHGWTWKRTLRDNSNEWARPGRNERSAVVDYEDSPVMSLLSRSEDTGLSDLLDARIPLTKYRVLLRLKYNDDEKTMVQDLIKEITEWRGE